MNKTLMNLVLRKACNRSRCISTAAAFNTSGHVLIGGGTGFIGSNLTAMLLREKYKVTTISRYDTGKKDVISWEEVIFGGIPDGITAVVNLAGSPIWKPFDYFYKPEVFYSRIGSTWLLAQSINCAKNKPTIFIVVTSTNIYPANGVYTEDFNFTRAMMHNNFFTELGVYWEMPMKLLSPEIRWVSIRTGMVLGQEIDWIGDGNEYAPWIHIDDLLYLILFSMENPRVQGILNGVSPENITKRQLNAAYTKTRGKSPYKVKIPKTVLIATFGIERTKLLLNGRQVLPTKTLSYGFTYEYREIEKALTHLLFH